MRIFGYEFPPDYKEMARRAEEREFLRLQRKEDKKRAKVEKYQRIYDIMHEEVSGYNVSNWSNWIGGTGAMLSIVGSLYQGVVSTIFFIVWFFVHFSMGPWPVLGIPLIIIGYLMLYWAMVRCKREAGMRYYLQMKYQAIETGGVLTGVCMTWFSWLFIMVMDSDKWKGEIWNGLKNNIWFMLAVWLCNIVFSCLMAYSISWSDKVNKYGNTNRTAGNR